MIKLTVAIPCYNEAENVPRFAGELVPEVRKIGVPFEILIVDDGSSDGTAELAARAGIPELRVVRHPRNQGLGAAIRTIFREARGDLLVTLDADLTFDPKDIRKLLERYERGDVDFVIGSHGLAGYQQDIARWRVAISKLSNGVYSVLARRRVRGISSIFRLYRTDIVRDLPVTTSGYETPTETFFRLVNAGRRFSEVPTPLGRRRFGTSKLSYRREIPRHLRLVRDILLGRLSGPGDRRPRIRAWLPGIAVAVSLGVVYSIPNVAIPLVLRSEGADLRDYHPLSLGAPVLDEVASYGARIREVIDGRLRDSDAFLWEYKDQPSLWGNAVSALLIGLPAKWFGVRDPSVIFVIGDFLFPFLSGVIAFGMVRLLIRDRWVAAAAAAAVLAFPNYSALRFGLSSASLAGVYGALARIFDPSFSRIAIPSPGIAALLAYLWSLLSVLREESPRRLWMFSGALLGFTSYIYFYYGAFSWIATAILFCVFLLLRRWNEVRKVAVIGATASIVSVPYVLHFLAARSLPYAAELQRRIGVQFGREPRISLSALAVVAALVVAFLVFGRVLNRVPRAAVLVSLLLATLAVVNIQLVLGFNIQPDHWGSRVNVYIYALGILVALVWGWEAGRRPAARLRTAAILALIFFLGIGVIEKIRTSMITAPLYRLPAAVQEGYRWIDRNAPRDAVVVSPSSRTSVYVPFFTHANVYYPPACFTSAPQSEIRERWLELVAAFGVPENLFRASLLGADDPTRNPIRGEEFDPVFMLFCDYYASGQKDAYVSGDSRRDLPEEVAESLLDDHRSALENPPGGRLNLAHRADYVFFGPLEKRISSVDPERYENLALVYENPSVRIYRIE